MEYSPASSTLSDDALWHALALRDPSALTALYTRYFSQAYALALHMLGDSVLAEECTHTVFLTVWQRPAMLLTHPETAPQTLLALVRLTVRDQRQRQPPEATLRSPAPLAAARPLAAHALARLAPEERDVLELAYFDGLTQRQIAARLDLPQATVQTRLQAALHTLRTQLTPPPDLPLALAVARTGPPAWAVGLLPVAAAD